MSNFFKKITYLFIKGYFVLMRRSKIWLYINDLFINFAMQNIKTVNHKVILKFANPTLLINYGSLHFQQKNQKLLTG